MRESEQALVISLHLRMCLFGSLTTVSSRHLQVIIQSQLGKFKLQMDSEVHVLHRVDHDVDELHASDLDHRYRQI